MFVGANVHLVSGHVLECHVGHHITLHVLSRTLIHPTFMKRKHGYDFQKIVLKLLQVFGDAVTSSHILI